MNTTTGGSYGRRGLYRARQERVLAGVCGGLAKYLDVSPRTLRLVVILLVLFTGIGLPVFLIAYFVAVLLIKPEPPASLSGTEERAFYDECVSARGATMDRLRHTYDSLDRRIRRMESIVTSQDFQWDQRLKQ